MKKLLYQIHRWAGIALALFMLIWFASGLVIMYAPSSALGAAEQLARRDLVKPEVGWLSLGEAWERSAAQRSALPAVKGAEEGRNQAERPAPKGTPASKIIQARLVMQAGLPLWLIEDGLGRKFALSALDGQLHPTSVSEATRIAANWVAYDDVKSATTSAPARITHLDTGPQDSSVRNHQALSPFHRLAVGDAGRELLISVNTGEVVRDSTPLARGLYWAGNWVHLWRPLDAIGLGHVRRDVLTWLGAFAVAASLTGLIIGWQRWRPGWGGRATYSQGRVHPYRDAWNTWHFWAGLIGGSAALLWAFSGFLNNNPFNLFSQAGPTRAELSRYLGPTPWPAQALNWRPAQLPSEATSQGIVELSWRRVGDHSVLLGLTQQGERLPQALPATHTHFPEPVLLEAATRLAGSTPVASHALQADYDSYYYRRHDQSEVDKPLPVLRVDLADDAGTRLYLDPQDGKVLLKQDSSRRVYRWLFSAVHHWDFGWLSWRPVWDLWMLTWVLMGLALAATSLVLGYKRLALEYKTAQKQAQKRRQASAPAPLTS